MPDIFYRRNLPHIHPDGYPLFITFRLANSLPVEILHELRKERELKLKSASNQSQMKIGNIEQKLFDCYDEWLDHCETGPRWLEGENIAGIVSHKIHEMHNNRYKLLSFCILSNHVHMLIEHFSAEQTRRYGKSAKYPVADTLRLLKGSTARDCNLALKRNGQFWHQESYDHFVRDEAELTRIIQYILNNPVKAGLAKEWKDWNFTYINPELGEW